MRSIQKKVRGTDGRKSFPKITAFPTWQSFENEVEFVWRNAREFNEDDSEIVAFAGILEVNDYKSWISAFEADCSGRIILSVVSRKLKDSYRNRDRQMETVESRVLD